MEDEAIIAKEGDKPLEEAGAQDTDYLDELERLASLRDQGIISEEEFEAKKKQLLGL